MEIDETKQFMYMQDNGDGTSTITIKTDELPEIFSVVMDLSFDALLAAFGPTEDQEERLMEHAVVVPNGLPVV